MTLEHMLIIWLSLVIACIAGWLAWDNRRILPRIKPVQKLPMATKLPRHMRRENLNMAEQAEEAARRG
jgi:hypothetical protein